MKPVGHASPEQLPGWSRDRFEPRNKGRQSLLSRTAAPDHLICLAAIWSGMELGSANFGAAANAQAEGNFRANDNDNKCVVSWPHRPSQHYDGNYSDIRTDEPGGETSNIGLRTAADSRAVQKHPLERY
jgi:hypothetical protein